jgi:hypothetical protein
MSYLDLKQIYATLSYLAHDIKDQKLQTMAVSLFEKVVNIIENEKLENFKSDRGGTIHALNFAEEDVLGVITELGHPFERNYPIMHKRYFLDIYFPEKRVALEVNGPTHYIKEFRDGNISETDELNGRTTHR